MSTLLMALVGGVPTLINSNSVARSVVTDTNGGTALVAGNFISKAGGTIAKADAPTLKNACGYVLAAVLASAAFSFYTDGVNDQVSGYTAGEDVVLGTAGAGTTTPTEPAGTGNGWQQLGQALSATSMSFHPGQRWTRA